MSIIQSFEIKNFRCFKDTKVSGLGTINLFGGKNNVGKTTLLEALQLMCEPSGDSILRLLTYRKITTDYIKSIPDKAWESFFYMQEKNIPIELHLKQINKENTIRITLPETVYDFVNDIQTEPNNKENLLELANYLLSDNKKSVIDIETTDNDKKLNKQSLAASEMGIASKKGMPYKLLSVKFIPASVKLNSEELATQFGKAKLDEQTDKLLKAFKVIDNNIELVDSVPIGKTGLLYLKKTNQKVLPISLFGDAMNKVADYVLSIVNKEHKVLLIDEIENGIHHENQEKFWKMLFDLCNEFQVQVFATSHSQEMITAFNNVVKKNDFDGHYYKLAYHSIATDNIVAQKISTNVLEDKIENHQPYRG